MQCWEWIVDKTGTTYPRMLLRKIDNQKKPFKKFSFSICKLEGGVSVCVGGGGGVLPNQNMWKEDYTFCYCNESLHINKDTKVHKNKRSKDNLGIFRNVLKS